MASQRNTTTGIIFLTLFIDLIGFSVIFPLFPALLDHYFAAEGETSLIGELVAQLRSWTAGTDGQRRDWLVQTLFGGIVGSVYSLLQFLFSPVWGRLSDRHGRRPILLITVAGIAVSHGLWAVSGSFVLFIVARLLGGIMAGNISAATAAMADITSASERARGMGIIGVAFGLGFILGPALGAALWAVDLTVLLPGSESFGLHPFSAAAFGALLLSLINLVWIWRRFNETLPEERRGDLPEHRTINVFAVFDRSLTPGVQLTNLSYFVFLTAFSGMEFTLVFLARERFGWNPYQLMYVFVFAGLVLAFVQGGLVRRLVPRTGERPVAVAGLALFVPGMILLAFASTGVMLYVATGLVAVGSGLATPTLTALVSLLSPATRQGHALGIFRALGALARAIGPILACVVYWRWGSAAPYLGGAALLLVPIVLTTRIPVVRHRTHQ